MSKHRLNHKTADALAAHGFRAYWKHPKNGTSLPATLPQLKRTAAAVLRKRFKHQPHIALNTRSLGDVCVVVWFTPNMAVIQSGATQLEALAAALLEVPGAPA